MKPLLLTVLLSLSYGPGLVLADTGKLQRFEAGDMRTIESRYSDRPWILVLWSLTCPPCLHELDMLGQWHARNPHIQLVTISTDVEENHQAVIEHLKKVGLSQADNWVFAGPFVEKLRFAVDPQWRGTLPRSYLYEETGGREAVSGALSREQLLLWQRQQEED